MNSNYQSTFPLQQELFETSQYLKSDRWGFFSIVTKDGNGKTRQKPYSLNQLPAVLSLYSKQRDVDAWISQATFDRPSRRSVNMLSIGVLFIDLDYYKDPRLPNDPDKMAHLVLEHCRLNNIPEPSVIINSGRGLQIKWFHSILPSRALPRWHAVEDALIASFNNLAVDNSVRDVSRVLRIVNSVNQKNNAKVEILHINWDEFGGLEPKLHDFNEIADQVLPLTRDELNQLRTKRLTVIQGSKKETSNLVRFSRTQLAWDRMKDIELLAKLRYQDKIPEGHRNQFLWLIINFSSLALWGRVDNFWNEAYQSTQRLCDYMSQSEIRSNLSTVYAKTKQMARGEWVTYNGKKYPPLYTPKNDTLINMLKITKDEERQLKTIISKDVKNERKAEKNKADRRKAGSISRAEYEAKASMLSRNVKELKGKGYKQKYIAEELGITAARVCQILKN